MRIAGVSVSENGCSAISVAWMSQCSASHECVDLHYMSFKGTCGMCWPTPFYVSRRYLHSHPVRKHRCYQLHRCLTINHLLRQEPLAIETMLKVICAWHDCLVCLLGSIPLGLFSAPMLSPIRTASCSPPLLPALLRVVSKDS